MESSDSTAVLDVLLGRLLSALHGDASERTCLRRWSEFVRARDQHECVLCGGDQGLSAHHICRKSFVPGARFEPGNGITLCRKCHVEVHAGFNGRADIEDPMDAEGGEKIEILSDLYVALFRDSVKKGYRSEYYYYLSDRSLATFKLFQSYAWDAPFPGTRIKQAATIWSAPPLTLVKAMLVSNAPAPPLPAAPKDQPVTRRRQRATKEAGEAVSP